MEEKEKRKSQLAGLATSLGVHGVLILLFIFAVGFTAPNPPLSEQGSGVELNLGLDTEGSGDYQQPVAISPSESQEEPKPEEAQKSDPQTPQEEVKDVPSEETAKPKEDLTADDEESPVVTKEVKKEPKKTDVPKEKVVVKKPKDSTPKEEKKEVVKVDKKSTNETAATKKETGDNTKKSKGVSQGDDKGKTGDKGSPEGTLDPNAQYTGKAGKGGPGEGGDGGISVKGFDGFEKPKIPAPEVPEDSYGTYAFRVTVNSEGEVEKITTTTKGSSIEAEAIFKKLILTTEFVPLNSNLSASSDGTITFRIIGGKKK